MKKLLFVILCFFTPSAVSAQSDILADKIIEIQQKYGVVSIIVQPDSPVVFEEVQLFTDRNGTFPRLRYLVRNRSQKGVASVSIEFHQRSRLPGWERNSDSWIDTTRNTDQKVLMLPGETYENMPKVSIGQLLEAKESRRILDGLGNGPKMLTFWIGFVRKVVFVDGTEFTVSELGNNIDDILLYNGL